MRPAEMKSKFCEKKWRKAKIMRKSYVYFVLKIVKFGAERKSSKNMTAAIFPGF